MFFLQKFTFSETQKKLLVFSKKGLHVSKLGNPDIHFFNICQGTLNEKISIGFVGSTFHKSCVFVLVCAISR